MSSDRLRFQSWVEGELGCTDLAKWQSYKAQLAGIVLTGSRLDEAQQALGIDAISLLTKALISFCGGVRDIGNGHINWGLVKLYYSLFYSSRSTLCAKRQGMVRNQSWFRLDLTSPGNAAIRLNSARYRNDHEAALYLYEDLYGNGDPLLSNLVENTTPYQWMMETRNLVNYRLAHFSDPEFPSHIQPNFQINSASDVAAQLDVYLADLTNTLTFQPEHAWLAIPFKQIVQTSKEIRLRNLSDYLSQSQISNINAISSFFSPEGRTSLELQSILSAISEVA